MTELNAKRAGNRIWLLAGLLAVVAIAGYFSFNYPPSSGDTAGTIMPATRYQADDAGGAAGGAVGTDKSGISSVGIDSRAAAADASDAVDRADHSDAVDRADHSDAVDRADHSDAVDRADHSDAVDRADHSDAVDRADHSDAVDRADHSDAVDRADHSDSADSVSN
jgi:hypothetical protein